MARGNSHPAPRGEGHLSSAFINPSPTSTNCVLFTAWTTAATYGKGFTGDQWNRWVIAGDTDIEAGGGPGVAVEWGIASWADYVEPGSVYLVQYYRDVATRNGHSLFIIDYDKASQKILTLEANSAYAIDGVGFGELGNIATTKPGPRWSSATDMPWSRIKDQPLWYMAKLNMAGVNTFLRGA